jgi:hypothetical protein
MTPDAMTTTTKMPPATATRALGDCFAAQRALCSAAAFLSSKLGRSCGDADLLRLGSTCLSVAARAALAAHSEREALRSWRQCALAERQIRCATAHALATGYISNVTYDEIFGLVTVAARARQGEQLRLRRRLQLLDMF